MDQTATLADALSKTPSLLGNLLSQIGGDLGAGFSQSDLFSSLLSQNGGLNGDLDAALSQMSAATPAQTFTAPTASVDSASAFSTSASSSSGSLLQNLDSLSSSLHKVLQFLQQQNGSSTNSQNQNNTQGGSAATSATAGQAAQTPAPSQDATTQATAPQGTGASTPQTAADGSAPATSSGSQDNGQSAPSTASSASTPASKVAQATQAALASFAAASAPTSSATASTPVSTASGTDTGVNDIRKLADIVAQLLLLIQMIAQNLRQAPAVAASGTDATQTIAKIAATLSPDAIAANAGANANVAPVADATDPAALIADGANLMEAALASLSALTKASTAASGATPTAAATVSPADAVDPSAIAAAPAVANDGSETDPLLQLLTALQKTARDLIPVAVAGAAVAKAAAANSNTDANAPVNSAAISDSASPVPVSAPVMPWAKLDTTLAAALLASADTKTASQDNNTPTAAALPVVVTQLATLEAGLKNVIALLQKQAAIATAANQTAPATATPAATQTAAPLSTAPTQSLASADASAKATDNWQSQLFGIASTTAPQAQPQTSGQVFAASAAMVSAGDKNTGGSAFDGGSDNLMGRDASPSFGNATNAAAITAEGAQAVGTYNFASQLSAFRAANGGTMGLPSVVDQVILQMNRSVKSGNDQMSLQLQPGDMGKITVKLDFGSDGKVQGTVTAENPKTLDMLQKDSRSLERALQDAGLRADPGSLQFSLGGQSNSQNANQAAAGNANAPGAEDPTAVAPEDDLVTDLGVLAETYYITPTGVNIRV